MLTNKFNIPLPLLVWLSTDNYSYPTTVKQLSATTLLRSPRYIIADLRKNFPEEFSNDPEQISNLSLGFEDVQDRVSSAIGTAIHNSVEQVWNVDNQKLLSILGLENSDKKIVVNPKPEELDQNVICVYTEKRTTIPIDDFAVSGQFDIVVDGQLHDIKTTSTYSWTSGCNDKKYSLQGSIYRWLNPEIITKDSVVINFIFTDWKKFSVGTDPNYPQARVLSKEYPLLSLKDTKAYIQNKLDMVKKYWDSELWEIPCCTEEELYAGKKTIYKYYKTGFAEGKRSTKNFFSMLEATHFRAQNGGKGDIVEHKEEPFKCPCCDISPLKIEIPVHQSPTFDIS